MVQVQCFDSPDLYETRDEPYSSYKYQRKKDREAEDKNNRNSGLIAVGCVVGVAAILALLLLWLI